MAVVGTLWRSAVMLSPTWSDRSVSHGAGLCRRSIDLVDSSPFRGSGSGCESEQSLHVVGHGHEVPLATDVVEATQQELAEPECRFDDAEHRLGRVLAQGVQRPALGCLQPMRHRLNRGWMVRRRRGGGEALGEWRVVWL